MLDIVKGLRARGRLWQLPLWLILYAIGSASRTAPR